jgi:RNA polymerase sigma-70 factor (ECF subfamily)|tara:strand:- start:15 stop:578 length:564 start_codon:yes stop_codon:yes gene_type:complete
VTDAASSEICSVEEAVGMCAAGDKRGIDRLLGEEGGRLLGVAMRMLTRRDLAEEAVQDTMVQVWRKAAQYRADTGSAKGWLYAILRNRCRNILRDEARLMTLSPDELTAVQDARQESVPLEGWEMLSGPTKLKDCLALLDASGREAILLAHVAGFTHGEISARLKVPLGTVKSWVRRSLVSLRGCLS